ncbi:MAG: M23 family metallopeptidase [Burkholderiales bacterium]
MRLTPTLLRLLLPALLSVHAAAQPQPLAPALPPLSSPVIEVAAFRVAPVVRGPADDRLKTVSVPLSATGAATTIAQLLALPATAAGGDRSMETRVQAAETWADILRRVAVSLNIPPPVAELAEQIRVLPLPLPGKFLRVKALPAGITEVEYVATPDESYTITIRDALLRVLPLASDPRLIERMRADPSKASLFTATDAIGLPESIALQLTELFAGEVDFHRELHLGYRGAIVYEAHYREGFIERSGRILAAELEVGKRRFQAYRARDTQGKESYFDASGKTTRRVFRRSPVEFTRITSDFTLARFHPILGIWRAHRGVDYAAPMGAKVMAVADGVIDFAGARGDYGNLIVLRHQDAFMTFYGHLSEFAPGIAVGGKVEQGQVIGLVGMTGLATGPHLHFEFHTRDAAGAWNAVPAPDVLESTVSAAPGFADVVRDYRVRLSVAETAKFVTLD